MKILLKRYFSFFSSKTKFYFNNLFGKYKYTFGKNWFSYSELYQNANYFLKEQNEKNIQILEIGVFEGLSTIFFIDNFLKGSNSIITTVDPFLIDYDNENSDFLGHLQIKNFFFNISQSSYPEKVKHLNLTSDQFFEFNTKKYNFIYIDGEHTKEQITKDILNSWECLQTNGIVWMDDYLGAHGELKQTFDETISSLKGEYEILHKGYQIAIKKL